MNRHLPLEPMTGVTDHDITTAKTIELKQELRARYIAARGWEEKLMPAGWAPEGEAMMIVYGKDSMFESQHFNITSDSTIMDAIDKYSLEISPVYNNGRGALRPMPVRSWNVKSNKARFKKSVTARFLWEAVALFLIAMAEREREQKNVG